jgi:hypothetical protein
LFTELAKNIRLLNYLEIELCADGCPRVSFRLLLDFSDGNCQTNRHRKESEYKHFLTKMTTALK